MSEGGMETEQDFGAEDAPANGATGHAVDFPEEDAAGSA